MQMVKMKDVDSGYADYTPSALSECPTIYLSCEQVEALGIKGIPAPGQVFMVQARAVVTHASASAEEPEEVATEGTAPDVSLTLALVDMGLQAGEAASDAERATVLYGG